MSIESNFRGYGGAAIFNGGADTFVFNPGSGNDNIWDFEHGSGATGDLLDVSGYGYTAFSQLTIGNFTPTQAFVNFGSGDIVYLTDVATLTSDDFIFA